MEFEDVNSEETPKSIKQYLIDNVFTSLIAGISFGIGHFIAYKFLNLNIFNFLRRFAAIQDK